MLTTDAKAPALTVPLLGGGTFDLESEAPENFTLVIFYRGLHCPLCKRQMETDVVPHLAAFEGQGVSVVAISMDEEVRARKSAQDWDFGALRVGYAMPEAMARDWGLYLSKKREGSDEPDLFSEPGMTLVRSDGTVYAHWQQSVPFSRPKMEDLLGGLGFVLGKGYPARGTA
ncbi:AhpC/TSA family protein [Jannaschia sp.]|nr:AhpC/TSA family protein [Jannaschia sp.]